MGNQVGRPRKPKLMLRKKRFVRLTDWDYAFVSSLDPTGEHQFSRGIHYLIGLVGYKTNVNRADIKENYGIPYSQRDRGR